ncbi:MAG TPA: sigma-70 family RNA polymerase sigma factor [Polyangia bacterium]|jgi:RNA polymerase sigma-70 factor (ECF subfamily)|nr:sigma-70 family RNA polymerase sigma factor [Polyangia bacterium]
MALDVEATYVQYGPLVLRRCRKLLRHDAKAQDAMQDVFVSLLRHEARLDDTAMSALLLRIATNVCLNKMRAERRHPEDRDDELLQRIAAADDGGTGDGTGEGRTVARNLLAKLFRADDPLAASTRTIATMHLVDGLTLEEVAAEAGMSVSGVRKRLRTLRGRLHELEGV